MFAAFPSLTIDDNIYVMGDYFSTDYSNLKTYTELEIKIDYYKVIQEALKRTHNWKADVELATGSFAWQDCPSASSDGFWQNMRNDLNQFYTDKYQSVDKQFYVNSTKFQKELDDYIDELMMGSYLDDLHPGAGQLYSDASNFVGKCF